MANLDFPSSPVDGQVYTLNGVQYNYNATMGAWLTYLIQNPVVANTSNTQIFYSDAGNANGSNGMTFNKTANTVYFNQVNAAANVVAQYFFGNGAALTGVASDFSPAFNTANAAFGQSNNEVTRLSASYVVANAAFAKANAAATAASPTITGTINMQAAIANYSLTDGANIDWNLNTGQVATVTLGGNRTMNAPTNLRVGTFILHVIQDATGSRTITWNAVFKWPAAVAPTLTTTGSRRDIISFVCDGTNLYGSFLPDVR
jgi:hypothetical protein